MPLPSISGTSKYTRLLVWRSGGHLDPCTHTLIAPLREGGFCVGHTVMVNDNCPESYDLCAGTTCSSSNASPKVKYGHSSTRTQFLHRDSSGEILHYVPRNRSSRRTPYDRPWLSHKVVVTNDEYSRISISQIATQLRDHTSTIPNIWTLDPDLDDPHSRTAIPACHYAN